MSGQKWVQNEQGLLELIDGVTGDVLFREKRQKPPRVARSGGRRPGRPTKAELALAEKNQPIRKQCLYEYDPVLGDAIADAIVEGEYIRALDPRHGFPPARELLRWMKEIPGFQEKIRNAEDVRASVQFAHSFKIFEKNFFAGKIERRGRPLGSKNKRKPTFIVASTSPPPPEINWDDIPAVIGRFGSWEVAMKYKKKITQT